MKINWLASVTMALAVSLAVNGWAQDKKDDAPAEKVQQQSMTLQLNGGKLIVIDKDGKSREIDVGDAKSVMIQQGQKRTVVDGHEVEAVSKGKAIIVGPDGESREIELVVPEGQFKFDMNLGEAMGAAQFDFVPSDSFLLGGKYFIGVQCQPIDESLRSHLKIEGDKGLIVQEVTPDSPAEKAGLKVNDILLFAGDHELNSVEVVVKAVNEAGEGSKVLELGIIRAGSEMSVQVTPEERKSGVQFLHSPEHAADLRVFRGDGEKGALWRMMPGVIRAEEAEEMKAAAEKMRQDLDDSVKKELQMLHEKLSNESVRKELERARQDLEKAREEMDKAREEMMRALKEELKRKKSGGDDDQPSSEPLT